MFMSRELLKKALDGLNKAHWKIIHDDEWDENESARLTYEIEAELAKDIDCTDHIIADASNKYVESGYYCVKCGALFKAAAVEATKPAAWASKNTIPLRAGKDNHPCVLTAFKCEANTVPLFTSPQNLNYGHVGEIIEVGGSLASLSTSSYGYNPFKVGDKVYNLPPYLYNLPPYRNQLPAQAIVECVPNKLKPVFMGLEDEFFEFARSIEVKHGIK